MLLKKLVSKPMLIFISLCVGLIIGIYFDEIVIGFSGISTDKKNIEAIYEVVPDGRWRKKETLDTGKELTEQQKKQIAKLKTIGYLSGSQKPPEEKNVTKYDKNKAYEGYNLVVSGHAPEATLINMEGEEVHRWGYEFSKIWKDPSTHSKNSHYWRRAFLLENGDLLAIFEGLGLIKLDKESNLVFACLNGAHHDCHIDRNGNIYLLTRKSHVKSNFSRYNVILEDFITLLDPNGNLLNETSILDAFQQSKFSPVLYQNKLEGDITHTNAIELVDVGKANPASPFRNGQILLSMHSINFVGLLDIKTQRFVWGESDFWAKQHQPTLLDNGNILLFDNQGSFKQSKVIEYNPITRTIQWCYGCSEGEKFYTSVCGSCQRLQNGNTLIIESEAGRAFEVTHEREIVWEYVNPHRAGKNNELIATLFDVVRIPSDFPMDWISKNTR